MPYVTSDITSEAKDYWTTGLAMASGSENRRRQWTLRVRLTDEERQALTAAADKSGLTLGSLARQALLGAPAPRAVRRPPLAAALVAETLAALGPIADEMRAVGRQIPLGRANADLAEILTKIAVALTDIRTALIRALGRTAD
jgi:hypothetical protein